MRIVFFGTPSFVVPIAESILHIPDCNLAAVVTNPDRPAGRHQILTPSPIKTWAIAHQVPVIDSTTIIHIIEVIKKIKPDLGILAAYGKIIPQELIDLFPKGILVIHPSLLPKYRGATPVQTALLNGDKVTGVSIIQMDNKMDHGPIVAQFKEEILEKDTTKTLTKRLFEKTVPVLMSLMSHISQMEPIPQDHSLATFTKLLKKDDGFIEWETLASQGVTLQGYKAKAIYNFIRAMTPWPGAWTLLRQGFGGQARLDSTGQALRLKILKAHLEKDHLILDVVQLEGKKPISWQEFSKRLF